MSISFRDVLKQQTGPHHARVDDALSGLDIAQPDGLARFLGIHLSCFKAMTAVAADGSETRANLAEMETRIQTDLDRLGKTKCAGLTPGLSDTDPLALDYMVEGSRLGSQILKRRWAASQDTSVQAANAYFSLEPTAGRWRRVCDDLAAIPAASQRASKITADTCNLFDIFYRASIGHGGVKPKNLEYTQ